MSMYNGADCDALGPAAERQGRNGQGSRESGWRGGSAENGRKTTLQQRCRVVCGKGLFKSLGDEGL